MEDLSRQIKKVMIVFLMLFVALISYFSYFTAFEGPEVAKNSMNKRLWAKRNEVLRGTIYDRDLTALTKSEKTGVLTQKREYLGGEVFSHALGYVNEKYGITGLESTYDEELMADNGLSFMELIKTKGEEDEKVGNGVRTTIDSNIQKTAFNLLGNKKGSVVVLNPKTGEVLAMVSKPSYDPNNLESIWANINSDENRPLLNRATAGLYPPGSVFKVVTAVAAIENISDSDTRIFNDTGKLVFNSKYSLSNYDGHAYGNINLKTAFAKSSNVVFGTLAIELGNDKLKAVSEKFMFNKDINGEGIVINSSRFPAVESFEKGTLAQTGIGQASILATPMEMALVASTVANNGVMMEPKLVNEVLNYKGESLKKIESKELSKVTSTEVADKLKSYMKEVVVSGTGKAAAVSGVTVAGKTGTADHDDKPNVDEEPHSWFIGFAPYENPEVAVAVIVEEGGTGGSAAAKIASGVFKAALK